MTKLDNSRVHFPAGKQQEFINQVVTETQFSIANLAKLLNISSRTLRDWRHEKYHMTYKGLRLLCKQAQTPIPVNIKITDAYSYTSAAGILGNAAVVKKYGTIFPCSSKYRQQQWQKWWDTRGKYNLPPQSKPIPIHKPKHSPDLAEFIGLLIGDGGITKRQITITLNRTDDSEYALYVQGLCKKLFKVTPKIYYRKNCNAVNLVISRSLMVIYLETLGLQQGDKIKYGVTIPMWIRENDSYLKKCLRGIFDTDGGIFLETHTIKNKKYSYMRLAFVSASVPLITALEKSLKQFDFHPKIRSGKRVQLEKKDEIVHYFKVIGSSNPKHTKRFQKMKESTKQ